MRITESKLRDIIRSELKSPGVLLERNAAVEFFRKNPKLLSNIAQELKIEPKKDSEFISSFDNRKSDDIIKYKLHSKAVSYMDRISGSDTILGRSQSYGSIIIGDDSNKYDKFRSNILDSKSFDEFIARRDITDDRYRWYYLPGETDNSRYSIDTEPFKSFLDWIKKHWSNIFKILQWYEASTKRVGNTLGKRYEKIFNQIGLSYTDVETAMSYILDYTSASRKKIAPEVFPLLQKLSVDKTKLPKYVYRGLFYDGAKVTDREKFLSKWKEGSKPMVKQSKATSWSADRNTAIQFMDSQDFIKDIKNGYYVLLRYKVDPDMVVADLRNLPISHRYWNQQELLISPDAKDYEIDTMIPGDVDTDVFRAFQNTKGGQTAWGQTKQDFALNFLKAPYDNISTGDRIEFKSLIKLTAGEFKKKYPGSELDRYTGANANVLLKLSVPMYLMSDAGVKITKVHNSKFADIEFDMTMNRIDMFGNYKKSNALIKAAGYDNKGSSNYDIKLSGGYIKQLTDDYYNLKFDIKLPDKFELVKSDSDYIYRTSPTPEYDIIMQTAFDNGLGDAIIEDYKNELEMTIKRRFKNNVKVTFK